MEWERNGFVISDDPARVDLDVVHRFLSQDSYWSPGVPRPVVERAVKGSLAFSLLSPAGEQVGFARVVTDRATFAWLADVFVLDAERGRGLAVWLMEVIRAHPDLQGLRRWLLGTKDAHGLYTKVGFAPVARPDRFLEIFTPADELYAPEAG